MAEWLTAQQVAAKWQCSPEHVQRLAKRGELSGMRLGARPWRFTPEAVAAYEAAHTTTVTLPAPAQQPAPTPVLTLLPSDMDGALPDRWWETPTLIAASSAAGRARSAGTKKSASQR